MGSAWLVAAILSLMTLSANAKDEFSLLRHVDVEHPVCTGRVPLGVAKAYFVPIKNKVAGKDRYNALVAHYRRGNWTRLDDEFATFFKFYESSPLREAATFLRAQSLLKRDSPEAEKTFREAILLYPRSSFVPVIYATVAKWEFDRKNFSKSLSYFKNAAITYPQHTLSCLFRLGVAESQLAMGLLRDASLSFQETTKKCNNRNISMAAKLRLANIGMQQEKNSAEATFDNAFKEMPNLVIKRFPSALYNIGELKFRAKKYEKAKYYFYEFLRHRKRDRVCSAYANKRLADIDFHQGLPREKVVGSYLKVHAKAPDTDPGKFSHLFALLLEVPSKSFAEFRRRVKIVDEKVDGIQNSRLRSFIYLEKGLAGLAKKDSASYDYLLRLHTRQSIDLKSGPIADYIRTKLLDTLVENVSKTRSEQNVSRGADEVLLGSIGKAYQFWLQGTEYERQARSLVTRILILKFEEKVRENELESGLNFLKAGLSSSLWADSEVNEGSSKKLLEALLGWLYHSPEKEKKKQRALTLLKEKKSINSVMASHGGLLWLAVNDSVQNHPVVNKIIDELSKASPLEDQFRVVTPTLRPKLWSVLAEHHQRKKEFAKADKAWKLSEMGTTTRETASLRYENLMNGKKYDLALELALGQWSRTKSQKEQLEYLRKSLRAATLAKAWKRTDVIVERTKSLDLSESEKSDLWYFAGKSYFEIKEYKKSREALSKALRVSPKAKQAPEAKFKLGKALLNLGLKQQARSIWEELVGLKDPFWSKLAKNEIKLNFED